MHLEHYSLCEVTFGESEVYSTLCLQLPPAPEGFKEWGRNTAMVMFAGIAFGGSRQWLVEHRLPDIPPPKSLQTSAQISRFRAEMQTKRLVRLFNGMVRGGLWFAGLGGLFFGVQGLSEYARAHEDVYNTVFGAWAAGGAMGFAGTQYDHSAGTRSGEDLIDIPVTTSNY